MKFAVLGAGSWGTALSIHIARAGHQVLLWGRDQEVVREIQASGTHPRRLVGIAIPTSVTTTSDLAEAVGFSDTTIVAVPCASLRPLLESASMGSGDRRFLSTAKGIEPGTLKRMSEIFREYHRDCEVAALSGPTFADEVARGNPSAAVVADEGGRLAHDLQAAFSDSRLRLYTSDDLVGVELAGALKNVVAIAAGIVSGLGLGHNTLAALMTRGLAEIGRIVRGLGGQQRTMQGLAGVGDLMLTCTGQQSRNRRIGEQIGRGRNLDELLLEMPEVAEGARTCLAVPTMAAGVGVEAPIAEAVVQVLYEKVSPATAIDRLMRRRLKAE